MRAVKVIFYSGFSFFILFILANAASAYKIIDVHEHAHSVSDAKRILPIMDELGIAKMVLLGSPRQTFYSSNIKNQRFDEPDKNNRTLLRIKKLYPDRFEVFCVFHQEDPRILAKLKACLKRGASGVKLFSGHGSFHTIQLDNVLLEPFYTFLEEKGIPVLWHVNTGKYLEEFEAVLQAHSNLKVICAHYCLASKSISKLRYLLDRYPNVYFDTSFGAPSILQDGIATITQARNEFHELFMNYPERFLFGTDYVITRVKAINGILENFQQNRVILEETLQLPQDILRKIYEDNWKIFLDGIPRSLG